VLIVVERALRYQALVEAKQRYEHSLEDTVKTEPWSLLAERQPQFHAGIPVHQLSRDAEVSAKALRLGM
jgi:hypothetical protein